ncbi:MAG: hypothetical protein Q4G36_12975 [Paracoccus sp. (in: a-proteobacteria)]|nr:hypothetical protein [Paracoccus sp. (in: a-proteobacteria)]
MAHITDTGYLAARSDRPGIFARFGRFIMQIAEANSRIHQVQALEAMSDAELAARGITRDRIVQYVFRDKMGY